MTDKPPGPLEHAQDVVLCALLALQTAHDIQLTIVPARARRRRYAAAYVPTAR